MRKERRAGGLFLAGMLAAALLLCGCGSASDTGIPEAAQTMAEPAAPITEEVRQAENGPVTREETPAVPAARKKTCTASVSLESENYDEDKKAAAEAVKEAGGYAQAEEEYGGSGNVRSLHMTLRIPEDRFREFLDTAAGIGTLVSRSEQTEDITNSYVDTQARITALEQQRDRLLELEEKAETLQDLLAVRDSLTEVQYRLESWQAQMQLYDDQLSYYTVDLYLTEKEKDAEPLSLTERLARAAREGAENFVSAVQDAAVLLALLWPVLAAAAVIIVLFLCLRRRRSPGAHSGRRTERKAPEDPRENSRSKS